MSNMSDDTAANAPAPAPTLMMEIVQPSPAWNSSRDDGQSFSVTKIVTLAMFVTAVAASLIMAMFVTFMFYRRFVMGSRGSRRSPSADGQDVESAETRNIPFLEGVIVANPCGSEQVAYKTEKCKGDVEMTDIVVKSEREEQESEVVTDNQSAGHPPTPPSATRERSPV